MGELYLYFLPKFDVNQTVCSVLTALRFILRDVHNDMCVADTMTDNSFSYTKILVCCLSVYISYSNVFTFIVVTITRTIKKSCKV